MVKLEDYFEILVNDAQNARFHISDFYREMGSKVEDKEAARVYPGKKSSRRNGSGSAWSREKQLF